MDMETVKWIHVGIAFNVFMIFFNLIGMGSQVGGKFVEWYLHHNGGIKIMAGGWVILIILMFVTRHL